MDHYNNSRLHNIGIGNNTFWPNDNGDKNIALGNNINFYNANNKNICIGNDLNIEGNADNLIIIGNGFVCATYRYSDMSNTMILGGDNILNTYLFGKVDISGGLILNHIDISDRLGNIDTSLIEILTNNNDATFRNIKVNRLEGPTNFIIDPSAIGDNTGTVQIKGNLEVLGATTTINSNVLEISDNRILINSHSLLEGGIDISYSDVSYHFLHIYESNSWTTGDSSFITKNIQGNDANFTNVFINSMDVSAKLNEHDTKLTSFNTTLSNFDTSLNDLLTTNKDASFTNVDISGIFKLNGTDISNRLGNFDTSLNNLLTIGKDASFNNVDISGTFKLNGTDISNRLGNFDTSLNNLLTIGKDASFNNIDISGTFKLNGRDISGKLNDLDTSLNNLLKLGKDASFNNVDISGIFKLNGRDISGKLNDLDTSLNNLLKLGKDASFTNVDISGIFKLNGTDVSNRLGNFDTSLTTLDSKINNISTGNTDLSFNNIDISGTLTLSDVSNLGNMDISINNHILNIDAKNVSYLTKDFSANTAGDIIDIIIHNFLNNSQIIIYFKAHVPDGNIIRGTNYSGSSNIKRNFESDISFNSGDEGLITITKIANTPFCSASIFK